MVLIEKRILRILFYLENFQMIANGERKFLPLSLFSQLSQDLLCLFKKSRFVEEVLFSLRAKW